MSKRRQRKTQYAALPFRPGKHGIEVLLVTSRETRRWVIPKGWPMKGINPHEAARIEAHEEAGLDGLVSPYPVGTYRYNKRLKDGTLRAVEVVVYPLRVTHEGDDWPEMDQRVRRWGPPAEAAALVAEEELQVLIMAFGRVRLADLEPEGPNPPE